MTDYPELDEILICNCGFNLSAGEHYPDCPKAAKAKLETLLRRVEVEQTKHHIDKAQSNLRRRYQLTRSERYGMDILSDEVREQLKELEGGDE